eukprot:GHVL01044236.1.p2 GENE.GHVL01044236.1~~GHVL01044236.1.p2  ORF type:complete len:250 (+),score=44.55 GHVL01044236.1:44-793(+)
MNCLECLILCFYTVESFLCHNKIKLKTSITSSSSNVIRHSNTRLATDHPILPKIKNAQFEQGLAARLFNDRIIVLGGEVCDDAANSIVSQLFILNSENHEKNIKLYINSPGGSVSAGLAIFDAMKYVSCEVETICFGLAASMGAFLLAAGTPGLRKSMPNASVMIHQPLGGARGPVSDIQIQAQEIIHTRSILNTYLANFTDQPIAKISEDTDRDFFMTPDEAKDYGLIDEVVKTKTSDIKLPKMQPLE